VSCYCDPTFEIRIEAKREDLKFFGALAAPVELLSCVWGAMFRIAARFNTRGGDSLIISNLLHSRAQTQGQWELKIKIVGCVCF
jgi:hypothetical protein